MNATPIQLVEHTPGNERVKSELEPRVPVHIRVGTMNDFVFIGQLQKENNKSLGFMHRATLESYIKNGDVLVADGVNEPRTSGSGAGDDVPSGVEVRAHNPLPHGRGSSSILGYIIGRDRYFKREDVGIIYQLCVTPGSRRSLIAASLVKAIFEKAAYGCKLFCCWCAQDLQANYFWESLGFVPLAFRTGSARKKGEERIHIFWQKRIHTDDAPGIADTPTPYWFPSQTSGGAIGEGRLVLPIPPGTHWEDAKPVVIPGVERFVEEDAKALTADADAGEKRTGKRRRSQRKKKGRIERRGRDLASVRARFETAEEREARQAAEEARASAKKSKREKSGCKARKPRRYHPKYVAAARELCARYLEEVQAGRLLPEGATSDGAAKYDVSRALEERVAAADAAIAEEIAEVEPESMRLLDAA